MTSKVRRLNCIPLAVPVQLVLGLPLGIATKRKRRKAVWLRPAGKAA